MWPLVSLLMCSNDWFTNCKLSLLKINPRLNILDTLLESVGYLDGEKTLDSLGK